MYWKYRKKFAASHFFMEMATYFAINDTISRKKKSFL